MRKAITIIFGFLLISFLLSCAPSHQISIFSAARYPDLKKVPVEGKLCSEIYLSNYKNKQLPTDNEKIFCKKTVSDTFSAEKKPSSNFKSPAKKIVSAVTNKSAEIIHKQIFGKIIPAFTTSSGIARKKQITEGHPDDGFGALDIIAVAGLLAVIAAWLLFGKIIGLIAIGLLITSIMLVLFKVKPLYILLGILCALALTGIIILLINYPLETLACIGLAICIFALATFPGWGG